MKKIISLFLAAGICLFSFAACTEKTPKYEKFTDAVFGSFDTVITVVSYQENQEQFDQMMAYTKERFAQLNNLYDIYNNYTGLANVKTINDNAGIAPVKVSQEVFDLIEFGIEWHKKSGGKVNIALGSVLKIWHDVREAAQNGEDFSLPTQEELEQANLHTDISKVILDKENLTVYLEDKDLRLDVGAIAKGYATEIICDELSQKYDNFAISAGGNVKTHGQPKDSRTRWGVGIQNPAVDENFEMVGGNIDLAYIKGDESLVCSGGYQRFFVKDGRRYHHLIDPQTLFPADYYQGVTILCEDSGVADALSTAVFMLESQEATDLVNTVDGAQCMLVLQDGTQIQTPGFAQYLKSGGITPKTP